MTNFSSIHFSRLRYKSWRLATRLLLGKSAGAAVGENLYRDLEEDWKRPDVASHILERRMLADAYVQRYSFAREYPAYFPRAFAFPPRVAYRLQDIVVSPLSGLYRLPGGRALQQSMGSIPRFYRNGIVDMLRPASTLKTEQPVIVFSPLDYFHLLWEAFPQVVLARQAFPETRVLMPSQHPAVMDRMLDLLGIPAEDRLVSSHPVRLHHAILVPRLPESGFVPAFDIQALRNVLLPNLGATDMESPEKLYISRSHATNRPIENESRLEMILENRGFRIAHFEEMDFASQLKAIRAARVIVAPHGAGLSNLLAARAGTSVLEIIFPSWFNTCYAKLSLQLGLHYQFIRAKDDAGSVLPVDEVVSTIEDLEGRLP